MPITTASELIVLYGNDDNHFTHVLDHLFSPAVTKSGYDIIRPAATGADVIQATIIRNLEEADLVLFDISQHSPNVFFELGIRTALDRPVVLVKDDKTENLPFDTSIINTYTYDSALSPWTLENQIVGISEHITASTIKAEGRNALWRYFGLTQRAVIPAVSGDPTGAKIDLILEEIKHLRLDARQAESDSATHLSENDAGETESDSATHVSENDERGDEILNFMRSALASRTNDYGQGTDQFTERYRPVLKDLAEIAAGISAAVRVVTLTDSEIIIDTGPFRLTPAALSKMQSRATEERLNLSVSSSWEN
jgi:hypothetical protein